MILTFCKKATPILDLQRIALFAMALLSILFNGCAQTTQKPAVIGQDWAKHEAQVRGKDNWQALGKLGIKVPNDGGSANLRWNQQHDSYQIDLKGPFGQGNLSITGAPSKVTLIEAGEPPQHAKTAEELIVKTTGWNIPVAQLAYWVRGLPAPNLKINRFTPNAEGFISELEQAEWKVTYGDYLSVTSNNEVIAMPGRITAEYKDVKLTLVIREWSFNPSSDAEAQP
ncbi:MAG: outer membrane lipoprotein LolB [Moraxellaceae bacterium]|nr:MAG: outer membrane lipoprotein LolB [Moraxellaceae bacterium]